MHAMHAARLKRTNVLCMVVLHLYFLLLRCTDYFLTAVVILHFSGALLIELQAK